jgi:hypothetical protein
MSSPTVRIDIDRIECDEEYWWFEGFSADYDHRQWGVPRTILPTKEAAVGYAKGWNSHHNKVAELLFEKRIKRAEAARNRDQ